MSRTLVRVGASHGLDDAGGALRGHALHVVAEPVTRHTWHGTPVASMAEGPGHARADGVAMIWGSLADVEARLKKCPDPVVIVVSPDAQPFDADRPVSQDRIWWWSPAPGGGVSWEVHGGTGTVEVREFDVSALAG